MAQHVVISGASGLIGSALSRSLRADGARVTILVRRPPQVEGEVQWWPGERDLAPEVLAGADAVVSLSGASVGRLPWTPRYERELLISRVTTTRTIASAVRALQSDAPAFVSASAVGYYGSAPGRTLTESSPSGDTFLAKLCVRWEAEAQKAGEHARVSLLRTAPIIHRRGVLKPLIQLTRFGVAGPIGPGTQIWPWISLEDEVRGIRHVIDQGLVGPVNLTGPTPASANDIGRALAKRMGRPFLIPAPTWALRLALSRGAADSLLVSDADVRPEALERSGFVFSHATAQEAVAAAI